MSTQLTSYIPYGPHKLHLGERSRLSAVSTYSLDDIVKYGDSHLRVHFDTRSFGGIAEPTGIVRVALGTRLLCTCDIRTWETTYSLDTQPQSDTSLIKAQLSAFIHEALLSWDDVPVMECIGLSGDFNGHRP